jgi:methyltransferase family protein
VVQAAAPTAARALLANLPKLHVWEGEEQVGGLNSVIGERLIKEVAGYDSPRVIETGAGATTLLFSCLDPGALVSIAPSGPLRDRIFAEATRRQIPLTRLFFVCDRSELALPRIAADRNRFDIGLIDGSHNWPSVFVDFCYINMMIPAGGTLFVDDVHLYSVSQLFHLLRRQQEQFEFIAVDDKMATFRKLVHKQFLPEWHREPYIAEQSPVAVD